MKRLKRKFSLYNGNKFVSAQAERDLQVQKYLIYLN
jgi:hypothetical protein